MSVSKAFEPFVFYANNAEVYSKGPWSGNCGYSTTGGPNGYGCFTITNSGFSCYLPCPDVVGRCILLFQIKPLAGGSLTPQGFVTLFNNAGAAGCLELALSSTKVLQVKNAAGAVVWTSDPGLLVQDAWNFIGVDADIGNSSGVVKVWVNQASAADTPVCDLSGVDLDDGAGDDCDVIGWGVTGTGVEYHLGEVAVLDSSGADNNSYPGYRRYYVLPVTGAGASAAWTPSAGVNYQNVDDPVTGGTDGDTTYNEAAAGAGADYYATDDLPAGVAGIVFVAAMCNARADDGGDPGNPVMRIRESGGTTADSTDEIATTSSYRTYRHPFEDVPGGTGWTLAQVNASQVGVNQP
jgi:hypothetical protein